jgi:hypothetical protein
MLLLNADLLHAGLVAETNPAQAGVSYLLADNGSGNRNEIKGGAALEYGSWGARFNALWRKPLVDALSNPAAPGGLRHPMYPTRWAAPQRADPFTVWNNREAFILEAILSYDGKTGNSLWAWNSDDIEDAFIATSLTGHYSVYEGATDPGTYADGNFDNELLNWTKGLPAIRGAMDLGWRIVFNPLRDLRLINLFEVVQGQSSGEDPRIVTGFRETLKVRYDRIILNFQFGLNLWGPENFNRDFNETYPLLWKTGLAWSLKPEPHLTDSGDRIGIQWNGVIRDRYSPNFTHRETQEFVLYCNFRF